MKKGFQRAFALSFAQLFLAAALAACGPVGNDSSPAHVHTLTEVPAVDARCEKDGNIAYWECDDCGKYFSDALGQTEISAEDVVIPAGHKPEAVQAVTADKMFACDSVAYYRCTVCGKTFSDEDCKTEITADDIFEQKTFLLSTAQVSVPETTSRVYATVNEADYTLAVEETHFAMRVFLGWEIGDADFKTLIDEMEEEHLEFRLNLNIDTEGTLANGQWYHFKLGYDADGAFGGFSDSDAFVHFNLLKNGGNAIEEAFLENGGVYVTLLRNGGQMIAYVEDLEGNLFELVRTTCFGDTPMARVSLGVNQGFVADSRYPATAKDGKLVIGTADPYLPQTAQENPGDIVDEPPAPPERVLSVGEPYDPGAALWGQPASYEIAQEGEGFRISWADGRGNWAKVYQNVTGYAEEEGKYLRLTFSVERTTDVYVLYRETADAEEETALGRADYEAGEHTVYLSLPDGAGSEFVIEYYLDAKANPVAAGSVLLSGADFVADRPAVPTEIGGMYDAASSVGNPRAYEIAEADGETSVSWADGRGSWEYVRQDVTGYKAENGYFRMTFTLDRKTKVGVYMNGNALLGHTDYEAGTHTVYIEMPENTAENFTLDYYFDGASLRLRRARRCFRNSGLSLPTGPR